MGRGIANRMRADSYCRDRQRPFFDVRLLTARQGESSRSHLASKTLENVYLLKQTFRRNLLLCIKTRPSMIVCHESYSLFDTKLLVTGFG